MLESITLTVVGRVDVRMEEDPEAMLIIMNISYDRIHKLSRFVDLDLLTKLTILADYLGCLRIVEPVADIWIDDLKRNMTTTYSKPLIQWLCISVIYRKASLFTTVTYHITRQAKGPIHTLDLPIRDSIVSEVFPIVPSPPKKERLY